jgi:hypothetical protein
MMTPQQAVDELKALHEGPHHDEHPNPHATRSVCETCRRVIGCLEVLHNEIEARILINTVFGARRRPCVVPPEGEKKP